MPFPPYHFGPSTFLGLSLRRYIDMPVFVLANIIVDIEVLLWDKWPIHRYAHTLLIGAGIGAVWGVVAYLFRPALQWAMRLIRLEYKSSLLKMIISGILGIWLHVVIDAIYHWDVRIFWPSNARPLYKLISRGNLKLFCIGFLFAALSLYAYTLMSRLKAGKDSGSLRKSA